MRILCLTLLLIAQPLFAEGWGTLKVAFEYAGNPPELESLKINGDCAKPPPNDSLTIGPKNELANVVFYLRSVKDQKVPVHPQIQKSLPGKVSIESAGCRLLPKIVAVTPGENLRWNNKDAVGHAPALDVFANKPNSRAVPAGATMDLDMTKPERLPVAIHCVIHPWMRCYAVVNENPYVGISDTAGKIVLRHVPEGEWNFVLWHGRVIKSAEINGESKELEFGRVQVRIKADDTTDLGVIRFAAPPL